MYLFIFTLGGLHCCTWAFSSCGEQGLLIAAASLVSEHRMQVCGLSCPEACRVFPDLGSNLCPLHCKVDSQPLDHQGSPKDFSAWTIF